MEKYNFDTEIKKSNKADFNVVTCQHPVVMQIARLESNRVNKRDY